MWKRLFAILLYVVAKMVIFSKYYMNNSVSICDEVIHADGEAKSYNEETKTLLKNIISETKRLYILLVFLLVTIALLIAVMW